MKREFEVQLIYLCRLFPNGDCGNLMNNVPCGDEWRLVERESGKKTGKKWGEGWVGWKMELICSLMRWKLWRKSRLGLLWRPSEKRLLVTLAPLIIMTYSGCFALMWLDHLGRSVVKGRLSGWVWDERRVCPVGGRSLFKWVTKGEKSLLCR